VLRGALERRGAFCNGAHWWLLVLKSHEVWHNLSPQPALCAGFGSHWSALWERSGKLKNVGGSPECMEHTSRVDMLGCVSIHETISSPISFVEGRICCCLKSTTTTCDMAFDKFYCSGKLLPLLWSSWKNWSSVTHFGTIRNFWGTNWRCCGMLGT
jgi:hypothetical protein